MLAARPAHWFAAIRDQRSVTSCLCPVVRVDVAGKGAARVSLYSPKPFVALLVSGVPFPSSGTYFKAVRQEVTYLVLGSYSLPESLRKQQNVRSHVCHRLTAPESLGIGPQNLCFNKLPADSYDNYCLFVNFF